ncbi:hypothetical protein TWF730_010413 [Orbilia blumenaviensis]|uniref:Kelch repeat-containing protein n=1 Tax=Orbilia blumenaviensis TaxID=1796055 RepID=A0AAV9UQQ1_9PEZI
MSRADRLQLCSFYDQRVHIFNETLYFMGGSYLDSSDIKPSTVQKLNKIDLSSELRVDGLINQTRIQTEDAPDELTDKDVTNGGIFFYDETNLWTFGAVGRGDIPSQVDQTDRMYRYDALQNQWSPDRIEGGEYQWFNNSNGFYATAPDGRNWYGGGTGIGTWSRKPGVLFFEGNSTTPKWSFIKESDDFESLPTPSTLAGGAVYLPIGEEGIIVLLGGWDTTKQGNQFQKGTGLDWDLRPLSDIFVYDIARNFWTLIPAKGDLPDMRAEFCLVVNSSQDGRYHNIVMYGGWNQLKGQAYADVWVLSLPSFRWINIADENNPDTRPSKNDINNPRIGNVGRTRHRCNLFKNTQMIVTGGIVSQFSDIKLNIDACNSSHPPIMVMDTSRFVWKASITPDEQNYTVPGQITSAVRERTEPDEGWPNDRLRQIFAAASSSITATPTPSSTSPPNPTETVFYEKEGLSTGRIAGIAAGGIVILVILIAGLAILFRRRKQSEPVLPAPYDYFSTNAQTPIWYKAELPVDDLRAELPGDSLGQGLPVTPPKPPTPTDYHQNASPLPIPK